MSYPERKITSRILAPIYIFIENFVIWPLQDLREAKKQKCAFVAAIICLFNLTLCLEQKSDIVQIGKESGHQLVLAVRFLKSTCSCGSGAFYDSLFVFRALQSHDHEPGSAFICMDSTKGPEFPSLLRISVASFGKPTAFSLPPYAYSETSDSSLQASLITLLCFPSFVPCLTFWVISSEVVSSLIIY